MVKNKLILSAVIAGCMSLGTTFAQTTTTPPADPNTDKGKLEDLKQKLEDGRAAFQAHHDSLAAEHKDEISKDLAEDKTEREKHKADMEATKEKVKALVDDFKSKMKDANDSTKKELAKELGDKLKDLRDKAEADHKAAFDAEKKERQADMDAHRADWQKRLDDHKAEFEAKEKEIEGKRDSLEGGKTMTPDQIAAAKAKFEEWLKSHQDAAKDSTETH